MSVLKVRFLAIHRNCQKLEIGSKKKKIQKLIMKVSAKSGELEPETFSVGY